MRVVFFGTPEFSADFLRALIADGDFDIVAVVTQQDELQGRKKELTPPPTKLVALEHNIPVLQPTKLKDSAFADALTALNADVFVVIAYGRIIPQAVLDIPPHGCVNVHPSLLPLLRGPSPIISAIANGDDVTGVTIMQLDADMDHGPILAQTSFAITPDETATSLTQKVVQHGAPLLTDTLKGYVDGSIIPIAQNHDDATLCHLLTREDGRIDWTQPAAIIDAKIRAYNPWPGTFTTWHRDGSDLVIKIISAKILVDSPLTSVIPSATRDLIGKVHVQSDQIIIGTGTTALEIIELQPAAGKRMPATAFIQGYRDIDGVTLG
ncbi:MAG: methionyl-tRNA formyltransferase [Patescibacteria group bacterium]